MKRWLMLLPFAAFAAVLWVASADLSAPTGRPARDTLIDQAVPPFILPAMIPGKPGVASTAFVRGQPRLLNLFASWCVPCVAEAPQLMALKRAGVRIDAIAIRDRPDAIRRFLMANGDPYASIGDDRTGGVQIALGSSGVPETFVIGSTGRIVQRHAGDIRADEVAGIIAAMKATQ